MDTRLETGGRKIQTTLSDEAHLRLDDVVGRWEPRLDRRTDGALRPIHGIQNLWEMDQGC